MTQPADCQPELNLRYKARRAANADAVNELCGLLRGRRLTSREIEALRPEWASADHRVVRRIAEAAGDRIVSGPGSNGYRLLDDINTRPAAEEMIRDARRGKSQAKNNLRSSVRMERTALRILKGLSMAGL